ncbi:MAG: hypothetical protein C0497_02445 [Gemmatimonas sp.]|nr:hypothetical protein [Gemmatimonas sp.]
MTGPGPIPGPRPGEPRTSARPGEPRSSTRRRPKAESGRSPDQAGFPWLERHAKRIRWATWIGIALIAIRLIAPRPDGWRRWSDAAAALADAEQARTAALLYYQAASRQWPAPGRPGVAPAGMLPFLPGDVFFARPRYKLAWEYAADTTTGAHAIGISVVGEDPRLAQTMAQRAPDGMRFIASGRRFVVLIASAAGNR